MPSNVVAYNETQTLDTGVSRTGPVEVSEAKPLPVSLGAGGATAARQDAQTALLTGASAGTQSNVSGATSSTTLLAANTARKGATIWNDSSAILYVLLSTQTASATLCTAKLIADAYYEVPFGYTGIVKGIWVSATGAARVTELT